MNDHQTLIDMIATEAIEGPEAPRGIARQGCLEEYTAPTNYSHGDNKNLQETIQYDLRLVVGLDGKLEWKD